jgi:hypothetical protein
LTCRIDRRVIAEKLVILSISGRITERDVDMLQAVLEQETSTVAIDLKQVVLADREAIRFFATCELNGTEIRNCPPYIREWVSRESADTNASDKKYKQEDIEGA